MNALLASGKAALLAATCAFALTACDSTPRERQAALEKGMNKLDTLADRAGDKLSTAAGRARPLRLGRPRPQT